jgi:hypothetical protein
MPVWGRAAPDSRKNLRQSYHIIAGNITMRAAGWLAEHDKSHLTFSLLLAWRSQSHAVYGSFQEAKSL